ncbi:UbiA prenyltransferase family [Truncatella angustata]|uniref:UbiA prenyltransferase family n=1 Tax=Truncatella angustata TaxID=152316 RepID=A0A9P8RNQ2_9PEZI|nr:UbiA prenyltransferase family [Truncatella angustata]KAH6646526.1 UbiA prenyltransferase family [Truncatella angustata]
MILWSWGHLLVFNLHNQLRSRAEDAINKPWRPIPRGRISEQQTVELLYFLYPLMVCMSACVGGLRVSVLELAACLWYNEFKGSADPLLKNLLNGIGITCFMAGPLELLLQDPATSNNGRLGQWIIILAGAIVMTVHVQDFRDMPGDGAAGRVTLPIAMGDTNARILAAVSAACFTYISCWLWEARMVDCSAALVTTMMLDISLFLHRSQRSDDFLWKKLWFVWILSLFLMPVLKVHI